MVVQKDLNDAAFTIFFLEVVLCLISITEILESRLYIPFFET